MRTLSIFVLCLASASAARADVARVYAQGQATMGEAAGLGIRAGAQVMMLEAYVDRTAHFRGSTITRVVGGVVMNLPLGLVMIGGRAGIGWVTDQDGGLDGDAQFGERNGYVARVGGVLKLRASRMFAVGLLLEEEYFAVRDAQDRGTNTTGALFLEVGLGL